MPEAKLGNLSILAAIALAPSVAAAFPITIEPGAYAGPYIVADGAEVTGRQTFDLAPGDYKLDDGNNIGGTAANPILGSSFFFHVDATGQVTTSSAAATGAGGTLTLQNATVHVAVNGYPYRYFAFGESIPALTGDADLVVIPGLSFTIDDASFLDGSAFVYDVDASGHVACNTPAASCAGGVVTLQPVPVAVNPGSYAFTWALTATATQLYSGAQTFPLLRGLVYGLDDGAEIGGSELAFKVGADGTVTPLVPAGAATGGASLAFDDVLLHVDSGGYPGQYRLGPVGLAQGSAGWFSGPIDATLIAGLAFVLTIDDGAGISFVPDSGATPAGSNVSVALGGATPGSFSFSDPTSAQSYTFTLGTTPLAVTFANVSSGGVTSVTTSSTGTPPPAGFKLGDPPVYYDLSTTAAFDSATVCIDYSHLQYGDASQLHLFHLEGGTSWVDTTISNDTGARVICGSVTSFSPFVVAEPVAIGVAVQVRPSSINLGSHGTVSAVVYGSAAMDAAQIDPATVRLAGAPVRTVGGGLQASLSDVNGDGLRDLVVHFATSALQLAPGSTQAILTGKTLGGTPIQGTAAITIVR